MKITVAGSGGWGTALAMTLCGNGHDVTLWCRNPQKAAEMTVSRENPMLRGIRLPEKLKMTGDPACVADCAIVVIASPSFAIRKVCRTLAPYLPADVLMVSVTKGIERGTLLRMSQIVTEETGRPVVALTGPSHAEEVARKIPTACLAASPDREKAELVQDVFMSESFRVYTSPDIVGAELGGAMKNVIALCAGATDGMGCGDNTKAMLMTRGLTEMARLGVAMGASKDTFAGLAGVGDLIVTCTSMHSRNCRAGVLIGRGMSPEEAMQEIGAVVEGYYAAESVYQLARREGVEMPIMEAAYAVLHRGIDVTKVMEILLRRTKKSESEDAGWL